MCVQVYMFVSLRSVCVCVCVCAHTHPQALDAGACDLLAVVQLDAVQAVAGLQVLQRGVCDERAVIQLDHLQSVVGAGPAAQVPNAIIRDQLTVGETLRDIMQVRIGVGQNRAQSLAWGCSKQ